MRNRIFGISILASICLLGPSTGRANADVCLTIDEAHDTFSTSERESALLLLGRQFELAGEPVVPAGCSAAYTVSHVRLGNTIAITLAGPRGHRDATAVTLDDVPAVYSQMVRSLLTGRPMGDGEVVDRTNVSRAQTSPLRVGSDSLWYARLGYGAVFGDRRYGGPSVGLIGYRKELDGVGIDVSFFNFQGDMSSGYQGSYYNSYNSGYSTAQAPRGMTGSWIKLEALRFRNRYASQTTYYGAGLSLSATNLSGNGRSWNGSGLQGELTLGYEIGRASTIRMFVQADAGIPFYEVTSTTYGPRGAVDASHRYTPSLAVSLGLGWQGRRRN